MEILACMLIGYLFGAFSPSYILGAISGFDIRKRGSGNAGASNVILVLGKAAGAVCALLDIAKACLAVWITGKLFPEFTYAFPITAASCILGHIFPFYMKFRGGKGLACLGGVVLMTDVRLFLVMISVELVVVLIVNYLCVVPMSASVIYAVIYGVMTHELVSACIFLLVAVVMCFKHTDNLRRIKSGTEVHFSYLWNKEKEIARIKENGATEAE
ncbi:MAG: glycerol-3-phosphate acyltransferase [Lachnospiraceae bacterium]|nr:glycerol-3-phosphate acyltransferase [Lachnospiraceae bacterium]